MQIIWRTFKKLLQFKIISSSRKNVAIHRAAQRENLMCLRTGRTNDRTTVVLSSSSSHHARSGQDLGPATPDLCHRACVTACWLPGLMQDFAIGQDVVDWCQDGDKSSDSQPGMRAAVVIARDDNGVGLQVSLLRSSPGHCPGAGMVGRMRA